MNSHVSNEFFKKSKVPVPSSLNNYTANIHHCLNTDNLLTWQSVSNLHDATSPVHQDLKNNCKGKPTASLPKTQTNAWKLLIGFVTMRLTLLSRTHRLLPLNAQCPTYRTPRTNRWKKSKSEMEMKNKRKKSICEIFKICEIFCEI